MDHKRSFYNDQLGWSASPEKAALRLDARQEDGRVSNTFYRKAGDRWEVVDEQSLSGPERGLVWQVWKTAVGDQAFLSFRGVRALDSKVAQLLDQITVYDEQGQAQDGVEGIGYQFLLDGDGAKIFSARLASVGGQIVKSSPISDQGKGAVDDAARVLDQIKEIIRRDGQIVQRAEAGDLSRLGELEQSQIEFSALIQKIEGLAETAINDARPLTAASKSPAEQEEGRAMITNAERIVDEARMLAEVRQDLVDSTKPDRAIAGEIGAGGRMLLYREMARLARQDGHEVETTDDGVRIKIGNRWLVLGEQIELSGQ